LLTIGMGLTSNIKVVSGSRPFRILNMHNRSIADSFL
jgi:hypothetical protein